MDFYCARAEANVKVLRGGYFQWPLSVLVSSQDCFPVLEMFQAQIQIIKKKGTMKMIMK